MTIDIGIDLTPQGFLIPLRDDVATAGEALDLVGDVANFDNTIPHYLEPIGDSGFYATPNEPVSPYDCARWPSSPFCSGNPTIPLNVEEARSGNIFPSIGLGAEVEINNCMICITVSGTILGITGPPYTICRVAESCLYPEPPQIEPREPPPILFPPLAPPGFCRVVWALTIRKVAKRGEWNEILGCYAGVTFAPEQGGSFSRTGGVAAGGSFGGGWVDPSTASVLHQRLQLDFAPETVPVCNPFYQGPPQLPKFDRASRETSIFFEWVDYPIGSEKPSPLFYPDATEIFNTCGVLPPPPPPRDEDNRRRRPDPVCNCEEIEDMLAQIYLRLGVPDFPVEVPKTVYNRSDKITKLQSIPEIFAWLIYQGDAVLGEWPVKIQIEDTDPTKEGNQSFETDLPNVAESLAEVFGLTYKIDTQTDILTEIVLRLVAEVVSIKNASIVTQDYVKANASYLGYRGNAKRRRIPYAFDPTSLDSLPGLLKNSTKDVMGWQEEDPETVASYLQKLQFAAGIVKATFLRNSADASELLESIRSIAEEGENGSESWRDFLSFLNRENSPFHRDARTKPQATDIPLVDPDQEQ